MHPLRSRWSTALVVPVLLVAVVSGPGPLSRADEPLSPAKATAYTDGFDRISAEPTVSAPRVRGVSDGAPGTRTTFGIYMCSVGFYAKRGRTTVMVTAKHCGPGVLRDDEEDAYGRTLAEFGDVSDETINLTGPGDHKAVVSTGSVTTVAHASGRLPIVGWATKAMLKPGQGLCKVGSTTGLNCALTVTDIDTVNSDLIRLGLKPLPEGADDKFLLIRAMTPSTSLPVAKGDSGGLVYAVRKGKAYVAGITSWGRGCIINGAITQDCPSTETPTQYTVLGAVKASVLRDDLKVKVLK